jgi:hypothetical protein
MVGGAAMQVVGLLHAGTSLYEACSVGANMTVELSYLVTKEIALYSQLSS